MKILCFIIKLLKMRGVDIMLFNSDDNNKSNIDSSGNSKRLFGAEDATFD